MIWLSHTEEGKLSAENNIQQYKQFMCGYNHRSIDRSCKEKVKSPLTEKDKAHRTHIIA